MANAISEERLEQLENHAWFNTKPGALASIPYNELLALLAAPRRERKLREALDDAIARMDRARLILCKGPDANWNMLNTESLRKALED